MRNPSYEKRIIYFLTGLFCVLLASAGCHKKTPESRPDSHHEQIQEVTRKAEQAALQADQDQKRAESELASVKRKARQVMTQNNSASAESALQDTRTAAETSTKAAQAAGVQAAAAGQCVKEVDSLLTDGNKEAQGQDDTSTANERARQAARDFHRQAQTSYDQAQQAAELAQQYLELAEQAAHTVPESKHVIESAHRTISSGIQNTENRQRTEDAVEDLEALQSTLGESVLDRSPEEMAELLDQLGTASGSLKELLALCDSSKDTGMGSPPSPQMGGDSQLPGGKNDKSDLAEIPGLPTPPKIIRTPGGGFEMPELPVEEISHSIGRWTQTKGEKGPDFLPGNYSTNHLNFKVNGLLEVKRTFGQNNEIAVRWRVGYQWNKDRSILTLGEDSSKRPSPASLRSFLLTGFNISAKAAVLPFPATIEVKQISKDQIQIGSKIYSRSTSD